jgi:polyhydroxyalkanoate synthesis regulator phasin
VLWLRYTGLVEVPDGLGPKGHLWADPCERHLQELMRHVTVHREEAQEKGVRARKDMVEQFSPKAISEVVMGHLRRLEGLTDNRRSRDEL